MKSDARVTSAESAVGMLCLNVASSTSMLKGFVNLDNHILLGLLKFPRVTRNILAKRHRALLESYEKVIHENIFVRHDCRRALPFADETVDHVLCSHFLEHVFPDEADQILIDFNRVLKVGGTVHIVLPDMLQMATAYVVGAARSRPTACDEFMTAAILSRQSRGSLIFRFLEFLGGYGFNHRWMYDEYSITIRVRRAGFIVLDRNDTPSSSFRLNDGSIHLVGMKPSRP